MAKENRDVRPFIDLANVQDWFEEHLTLRVTPAESTGKNSTSLECKPWSTLRVEPRTLATADVELFIEKEEPVLQVASMARSFAQEIGAEDESIFSILIIGSSSFLKLGDVLHRWTFEDLARLRGGFSLTEKGRPRPRTLQTPHSGFGIEISVVLNRELQPKVGHPHRLGTWLARSRFSVANPEEGIGFTPLSLTDEVREELKLRKQTTTYAEVRKDQPDLRTANRLDDFVALWVDKDTLDRLAASPRHAQSSLKQTEIFLEAIEFLVMEFHRLDDMNEISLSDIDSRLIGRLLRVVSSDDPSSLESWLNLLKTEPSSFMAAVQAQCDYRDRVDDALGLMVSAES